VAPGTGWRRTVARRRSLRTRITLAATAVVGIALLVGALLFVALIRLSLEDGVAQGAERDAETIVSLIESGGLTAVESLDDDDVLFQVTSGGTVLAESESLEGAGPLGERDRVESDGSTFLLARPEDADLGDDDVTVVAGRSLDDVDDAIGTIAVAVAIAAPLLVLLVSGTTWLVVGRALRPVERLRREVDEVTASSLDRRVADPGTTDEIGRLATTMNRMLDRLDASQRAQRQFISDASHELRSPLASLRQFAEVSSRHPERVTQRELSDAVLDEGARLERLVQNMLLLARADERTLSSAATTVDLDDAVLAEASRLRATTSIAVDVRGVGAARVLGDSWLLGQVVRNLADNAVRHAASRIAFELTETVDGVEFTVDDDGEGIADGNRERVFERFVRLDEARARDSGGSGLGLAIVRDIVESHGGTVVASASPLGGARLTVRLPGAS